MPNVLDSGSIQALLFADRKRNWIRAHRLIYLNRRKRGKAFRMQADRIAGFFPVLNVQRIHTGRHPKLCPAEVIPEAGLSGKNDFLNILYGLSPSVLLKSVIPEKYPVGLIRSREIRRRRKKRKRSCRNLQPANRRCMAEAFQTSHSNLKEDCLNILSGCRMSVLLKPRHIEKCRRSRPEDRRILRYKRRTPKFLPKRTI